MSQPEVPHLPMPTWLDVLRAALPVRGVLLVGAGMGSGPWVQWLRDRHVSPVHLVEGDPRQYQHLSRSLPSIDGWTSWRDVVAANTDPAIFYRASNPSESGLIQPEALRAFWPHLDTEHSTVADPAITLDSLDAVTNSAINWLILDCLPASELLQGGRQLLTKIDVALVRVVLSQGDTLKTARHDAVDDVLRAAGLTCCHVQAERNPALAHVLYVRDAGHQTRSVQERLRQANDLLAQKNHTLEERSQELEHVQALLAQERQAAAKHQKEVAELAANHAQEMQRLRQTHNLLEQKNHTLEERSQELERVQALLEQERQAAAKHQKEATELAKNHTQEMQRLRQTNDLLEQKNHTLEERSQELERVQALLAQEKQAAAKQQKEAAELATNQGQEIQRLRQANDLLKQENRALEERSQELERTQTFLKRERQTAPKQQKALCIAQNGEAFQANYDPLDWLICFLEKNLSLISNAGNDKILASQAINCLKYMLGDSECVELAIDRIKTTTGSFNLLHVCDDYIPQKVIHEGKYYELEFLQVLSRFHKPGGLIVDVGANIGNHTVYFSQVIGAKVAAFEPQPLNILCLELNTFLNNVRQNVTVHRCALGYEVSEISLVMTIDANYGSFSALPGSNPNAQADVQSPAYCVPVYVLDDILNLHHSKQEVSLIKIDVEGMELDVLRGASQTIQRDKPLIACECFNQEVFEGIEAYLSQFDYRVATVCNATPTFIFYSLLNQFHTIRLTEHLRAQALSNTARKKGFVRD